MHCADKKNCADKKTAKPKRWAEVLEACATNTSVTTQQHHVTLPTRVVYRRGDPMWSPVTLTNVNRMEVTSQARAWPIVRVDKAPGVVAKDVVDIIIVNHA